MLASWNGAMFNLLFISNCSCIKFALISMPETAKLSLNSSRGTLPIVCNCSKEQNSPYSFGISFQCFASLSDWLSPDSSSWCKYPLFIRKLTNLFNHSVVQYLLVRLSPLSLVVSNCFFEATWSKNCPTNHLSVSSHISDERLISASFVISF